MPQGLPSWVQAPQNYGSTSQYSRAPSGPPAGGPRWWRGAGPRGPSTGGGFPPTARPVPGTQDPLAGANLVPRRRPYQVPVDQGDEQPNVPRGPMSDADLARGFHSAGDFGDMFRGASGMAMTGGAMALGMPPGIAMLAREFMTGMGGMEQRRSFNELTNRSMGGTEAANYVMGQAPGGRGAPGGAAPSLGPGAPIYGGPTRPPPVGPGAPIYGGPAQQPPANPLAGARPGVLGGQVFDRPWRPGDPAGFYTTPGSSTPQWTTNQGPRVTQQPLPKFTEPKLPIMDQPVLAQQKTDLSVPNEESEPWESIVEEAYGPAGQWDEFEQWGGF